MFKGKSKHNVALNQIFSKLIIINTTKRHPLRPNDTFIVNLKKITNWLCRLYLFLTGALPKHPYAQSYV